MTTNFSFIIPHKNTPDLLQKCLDSIPRREDVQIIVVDDDSDPQKVNFGHFPGLNDSAVEVHLTKEGRGAGYARNVGLDHAVGKWIVFADADDFFLPDIAVAMEQYVDSDADVVFFKGSAMKIPSGMPSARGEYFNELIDEALVTGDCTILSLVSCPYKKFFNKSKLDAANIRFNECRWGNDVVFCSKVAVAATRFKVSPLRIYCITESDHSLIKDRSLESRLVRFQQESESISITRKKYPKLEQLHRWYFDTWFDVYKCSKLRSIGLLSKAISVSGAGFIKQCIRVRFH